MSSACVLRTCMHSAGRRGGAKVLGGKDKHQSCVGFFFFFSFSFLFLFLFFFFFFLIVGFFPVWRRCDKPDENK